MQIRTADIMYPGGSAYCEYIVKQNENVRCLVNQEVMPSLGLVVWVVVDGHRNDELRRENRDTGADRDPAEDVDGAAVVALELDVSSNPE